MLNEELKVKNFSMYKKYLVTLISEESFDNLVQSIGGEDVLMNASFGMSKDSGSAYEGSLIENMMNIAKKACMINEVLPESLRLEKSVIYKVSLLSHISKVIMYTKNTNDWEVKNRGMLYKFNESDVYLKGGERSILLCMNAGIKFDDFEYEAMRIMDRLKESEGMQMWFATNPLAMVIRQANEIIALENKVK